MTITGQLGEQLECEWCGGSFERPSKRGRPPRFCSPAHRQRAYEARRRLAPVIQEVSRRVTADTGRALAEQFRAVLPPLPNPYSDLMKQMSESLTTQLQTIYTALPNPYSDLMKHLSESLSTQLQTIYTPLPNPYSDLMKQMSESLTANLGAYDTLAEQLRSLYVSHDVPRFVELVAPLGERYDIIPGPMISDAIQSALDLADEAVQDVPTAERNPERVVFVLGVVFTLSLVLALTSGARDAAADTVVEAPRVWEFLTDLIYAILESKEGQIALAGLAVGGFFALRD